MTLMIVLTLLFVSTPGVLAAQVAAEVPAEGPMPDPAPAVATWQEADLRLSAESLRGDIGVARRALEAIHPGYDRYAPAATLDAAWEAFDAAVADGMAPSAFYRHLSGVLARIRCDHTKAELPKRLRKIRTEQATFFPFRFALFEEGAFVTDRMDGADALRRGDEILAINGRPFAEILDEIRPLIPVDGETVHAREPQLEATGEFLGSAFEHFYWLRHGPWSRAQIRIRRDGGPAMEVPVRPIAFDSWKALDGRGSRFRIDFKDAVDLEIEDGMAVLRVDTFVNYRQPVDPQAVYRALFERLVAEDVRVLILDTRLNGGGSTDAMLALLAHVADAPFRFQKARYVKTLDLTSFADVISTWDRSLLTPDPDGFVAEGPAWFRQKPARNPVDLGLVAPATPRFEDHLIALSSARNASGVTMMLGRLKALRSVEIIGEPTGGSVEGPTAGTLFFVDLPASGIRVRVPYFRQYLDVDTFAPGLGVQPDWEVRQTRADYFAGIDAALRVAKARAREILSDEIQK